MKLSQKAQACGLSPMRKFHPYAVAAKEKGREIFHLNIGQPDIETPPAFFETVKSFDAKVLEYAPAPGLPVLINAIRDYYKKLGVEYAAGDILITTGGSEALQILLNCILDEGSEVLIPEPFYPNYRTFVTAAGGKIVPIPTTVEEGYRYAVKERIEAQISENTRAIMVTNPGNPTGLVLTREELQVIVDVAREHELYIIGDEVYREFFYGGNGMAISLSSFPEAAENVVLIDSVSKRFSACGARIGCLISKNKELMAQAMKFCQARLCCATLDQVASAALYSVDANYFAAVREEYQLRRDTVLNALKKIPGVTVSNPEGAFYLMAALPVDDAEAFQLWLLNEFEDNGQTVMFSPAGSFYATPGRGKNEIRIAYVLKKERLERAMELLAIALEKYNQK